MARELPLTRCSVLILRTNTHPETQALRRWSAAAIAHRGVRCRCDQHEWCETKCRSVARTDEVARAAIERQRVARAGDDLALRRAGFLRRSGLAHELAVELHAVTRA